MILLLPPCHHFWVVLSCFVIYILTWSFLPVFDPFLWFNRTLKHNILAIRYTFQSRFYDFYKHFKIIVSFLKVFSTSVPKNSEKFGIFEYFPFWEFIDFKLTAQLLCCYWVVRLSTSTFSAYFDVMPNSAESANENLQT